MYVIILIEIEFIVCIKTSSAFLCCFVTIFISNKSATDYMSQNVENNKSSISNTLLHYFMY
jgi:hypothetical protein